jgi:hypothetical protein
MLAWRPGWAAGRALTSAQGVYCAGHAASDAALCFENRDGDGTLHDLTVELHAGRLTSPDGPTLPKVDTIILAAAGDPPGAPARSQWDLAPDGSYVAWSTRAAGDPTEVLHAQSLTDGAAPLVVARDVSQWAISPDGLAWYWLATYDYDVTGAPAGTLQAAAFPDGSAATTLVPAVGDFGVVGDKGLWLRTDVAAQVGTLRFMPDRAAPDALATVDTKVLTVLDHARDGSRFLYAKTYAPLRPAPGATTSPDLLDLYVGSSGGDAPCAITTTPAALQATLAPAGSPALWELYDPASGQGQGLVTTVAMCATAPFATRLGNLLPAGDDGYVYGDDVDETAPEATLRYARVVDGALAAATQIQTRAAPVFAPLALGRPAVVYTVATGTAADGLYVYAEAAP